MRDEEMEWFQPRGSEDGSKFKGQSGIIIIWISSRVSCVLTKSLYLISFWQKHFHKAN